MKGVVLCGGNSTRMGSDKGLLEEQDCTWAQTAAEKLHAIALPVIYSVNASQEKIYREKLTGGLFVPDENDLIVKGPLLGLLSVHNQFPNEDLIVLACDMKDMTTPFLQQLLANKKAAEAVVAFATGDKRQPLCGYYKATALQTISSWLQSGELKRFSMLHVLERLGTKWLQVPEREWRIFNNYNSPEDLASAH